MDKYVYIQDYPTTLYGFPYGTVLDVRILQDKKVGAQVFFYRDGEYIGWLRLNKFKEDFMSLQEFRVKKLDSII